MPYFIIIPYLLKFIYLLNVLNLDKFNLLIYKQTTLLIELLIALIEFGSLYIISNTIHRQTIK